jgi:hypothetical protein
VNEPPRASLTAEVNNHFPLSGWTANYWDSEKTDWGEGMHHPKVLAEIQPQSSDFANLQDFLWQYKM